MTVEDTIFIDAKPDSVWAVTVDVERWPEWAPTVTHVARVDDRPIGIGSIFRIKQPGQPLSDWRVTAFDPGVRFTWETERTGLRMKATHEMAADGTGTENLLRLEVRGAMATLLWPLLRYAVRRALSQENRGLKEHCESRNEPVR